MKITLTNFRCYKDPTTFDFIDKGSVLISGPSGRGKSSIMMGIDFALYNKGGKSIVHYGETKCRVEFVFKDLKIVRTRNPSRLVVNDIYEDEVGQEIIYNFFGKNFDVTGYISQNAMDSFLSKNPNAKREFLESVNFENENVLEKKEKLDALIKSTRQDLDKTIGQLEIARKMLSDEPSHVEFPLNAKDQDLAIKNENTRLKNTEIGLKKINKKISALETELQDLKVAETYLIGKDENLNQICKQIEELSLEANENQYIGDSDLLILKRKLEKLKANSHLLRLLHQKEEDEVRLMNMRQTEVNEIHKNIDSIKKTLWVEYSKEDALSIIKNNEDALKDLNRIKTLKKSLNSLKNIEVLEKDKNDLLVSLECVVQDLQSLKSLVCPSCETKLLLENNVLRISSCFSASSSLSIDDETTLKKKKESLERKIKNIEQDIFSYHDSLKRNQSIEIEIENIKNQYEDELDETDLISDLSEIQGYYKSQMSLENKFNDYQQRLSKGILSSSYNSYFKDYTSLCNRIDVLQSKCDDNDVFEEKEEDLRDLIEKETTKKTKLDSLKNTINSQEKLRKQLIFQIETYKSKYLEKYAFMADKDVLLSNLTTLKEERQSLEEKFTKHTNCLKDIERFLDYKKAMESFNDQKKLITDLEEQERKESDKHTKAKMVKNDLLESEHILLSNTVKDINATANIFLQEFFEDPIFANLSCFKEDKKKNDKPQIYLDLKYKHMDTTLASLSGGEYARVNLAFTLALAKIFNTPLLLLDETLSSLDEDIADMVFVSVKKHFNNIPVISILHQVSSEGDFDKVIKI